MSETLVATCIGGVLALAGGLLGAFVQNYFNSKREFQKGKIEAYITMSKALSEFRYNNVSEQTKEKIFEAEFYIDFFAPEKIVKQMKIVASKLPQITNKGLVPTSTSEDFEIEKEKLKILMREDLNER